MPEDAGSILLRAGLIGQDQLAAARNAVRDLGGTVPEHLVLAGAVDDEELTSFYRSHLMVPRIDEARLDSVSPTVIGCMPADMAAEFRTIPISLDGDNTLTVVMSDPSDTRAIDEIAFFTGSYIVRVVARQSHIAAALSRYYDHDAGPWEVAAGPWSEAVEPAMADDAEEDTVEDPRVASAMAWAARADEGSEEAEESLRPRGASGRRLPNDTGETQPLELRPKAEGETLPELAARSGELEARSDLDPAFEALPSIVLDEAALIAEIDAPAEGSDGTPILLEPQPAPPVEIEELPSPSEGVPQLYQESVTLPHHPRRRPHKPTRLGLAVGPAATVVPEAPAPADGGTASEASPSSQGVATSEAVLANEPLAAAPETAAEATEAAPEVIDDSVRTQPIPFPAARNALEDVDDWGLPGTTIPPDYLGAHDDGANTDVGNDPASADAVSDVGDDPAGDGDVRDVSDNDETVTDVRDVSDDDETITDVRGVSNNDDAVTDVRDVSDDDETVTDVRGISNIDDAVTDVRGVSDGDDAVTDVRDVSSSDDAVTDVRGVPDSDDAVTDVRDPILAGAIDDVGRDPLIEGAGDLPAALPRRHDAQRLASLGEASAAALEILRRIETAADRDTVIAAALDHLGVSFERVAFLALRGDTLAPWRVRGEHADQYHPTVPLERDSALGDVVRARLPYRGSIPDLASRTLLAGLFGRAPSHMLAVPITVRDRTVGVIVGAEERDALVEEHLALVLRAVSDALARLVAQKKTG